MECVRCVTQVAHYVWNKTDFDAVDPETTDYLMGELLIQLIYFSLPSKALLFSRAEYYMKAKHSLQALTNKTTIGLQCPCFTHQAPGRRFHLVTVISVLNRCFTS